MSQAQISGIYLNIGPMIGLEICKGFTCKDILIIIIYSKFGAVKTGGQHLPPVQWIKHAVE